MSETNPALDNHKIWDKPLAYNVTEVNTYDTVAPVFLGILSIILLIALLRLQSQVRLLLIQSGDGIQ
jgi:hypothetical protein